MRGMWGSEPPEEEGEGKEEDKGKRKRRLGRGREERTSMLLGEPKTAGASPARVPVTRTVAVAPVFGMAPGWMLL